MKDNQVSASSYNGKYEVNIAVVGAAGVGKTALLKRLTSGKFVPEYVPTDKNTAVYRIPLRTNIGTVTMVFHDFPGQKLNSYANNQSFSGYLCVTDDRVFSTTRLVNYMERNVKPCLGETIPRVLVFNKIDIIANDCKIQKIVSQMRKYPDYRDVPMYMVSAKSMYNLEKPLMRLLEQIFATKDAVFTL